MFASLKELKAYLLAEALRLDTSYDAALTAIGEGVAAQFEQYCNRKFARQEDAQEIFGADRCQFLLARFPVEQVTLAELKLNETDGFVEQASDFIRMTDLKHGIIYLPDNADAGPYYAQVRFTFTGGFWFDTSDEGTGEQPEGSTKLPDDLKLAWLQQCQEVWKRKDKLGAGIVEGMGEKVSLPSISELRLIPVVKEILSPYIRIQMS